MTVPEQVSFLLFLLISVSSTGNSLTLGNEATVIQRPTDESGTCQSSECMMLAANIQRNMNMSQNPCSDFYNFACGNFPRTVEYNPAFSAADSNSRSDNWYIDEEEIIDEKIERKIYEMLTLDHVVTSKDSDVSDLYNFTRGLYRSCRLWRQHLEMDTKNVITLSIQHLITSTTVMMKKMLSFDDTLRMQMESILATLIKTGRSLLKVRLPDNFASTALTAENYNINRTIRAVIKVDFRNYSNNEVWINKESLYEHLAQVGAPWKMNFAQIKSTFDAMLAMRITMFDRHPKLYRCIEMSRNPLNQTLYFLSELDNISSCVDPVNSFSWKKFFTALLGTEISQLAVFELENPMMVLGFAAYLKSRPTEAGSTSVELFSNDVTMLIFDWMLGFPAFYPDKLRRLPLVSNDKNTCFNLPKGVSYKVCQDTTVKLLLPIAERMYQKAYHRQDFSDVKRLAQIVRKASMENVLEQSWIPLEDKRAIVDKMQKLSESIGVLNARDLKKFYSKILSYYRYAKQFLNAEHQEMNFGSLMLLACRANTQHSEELMAGTTPVSVVDLKLDKKVKFVISSLKANPVHLMLNHLLLSMGFLETPMYHPTYPEYIKLGAIGFAIGHYIGHSFDPLNYNTSQLGIVGKVWGKEMDKQYHKRIECVRNHYGNHRLYPLGPLNNTVKIDESVSDLMGISAATKALEMMRNKKYSMTHLPNLSDKFSPEQMLFIHVAQSFCFKAEPNLVFSLGPNRIRIMGAMRNSQKFAEAFKCPSGSPMNPPEKCTIW